MFFSRAIGPISIKLGTKHPRVKGCQSFFVNKGHLNPYKLGITLLINVMI